MPDYFVRPEVPGQKYFRCTPLRATLSVSSCASRWRGANLDVKRIDPMNRCGGCRLGAEHAGERVIEVAAVQAHRVCSRCLRPSSRLIHGVKCVSCFNRELEVVKGRNAKGLPPVKHPPLGVVRVLCRHEDDRVVEHITERCTGAVEAVVAAVHKIGTNAVFGFSGAYRQTWGSGVPVDV